MSINTKAMKRKLSVFIIISMIALLLMVMFAAFGYRLGSGRAYVRGQLDNANCVDLDRLMHLVLRGDAVEVPIDFGCAGVVIADPYTLRSETFSQFRGINQSASKQVIEWNHASENAILLLITSDKSLLVRRLPSFARCGNAPVIFMSGDLIQRRLDGQFVYLEH